MKKRMPGTILVLLLCLFLSGCSLTQDLAPRHYRDPFSQAADNVPFSVGGTMGEFWDSAHANAEQLTISFAIHEEGLQPGTDLYLLRIGKLRELALLDDGHTAQQFSLMEMEVLKVFHDSLGLQAGDKVTVISFASHAKARGTPYVADLQEGRCYYSTLSPLSSDPEDPPILQAQAELAEYQMSGFYFNVYPLHEDGTVEFFETLLAQGRTAHHPIYASYGMSVLPQEEFEAAVQRCYEGQ